MDVVEVATTVNHTCACPLCPRMQEILRKYQSILHIVSRQAADALRVEKHYAQQQQRIWDLQSRNSSLTTEKENLIQEKFQLYEKIENLKPAKLRDAYTQTENDVETGGRDSRSSSKSSLSLPFSCDSRGGKSTCTPVVPAEDAVVASPVSGSTRTTNALPRTSTVDQSINQPTLTVGKRRRPAVQPKRRKSAVSKPRRKKATSVSASALVAEQAISESVMAADPSADPPKREIPCLVNKEPVSDDFLDELFGMETSPEMPSSVPGAPARAANPPAKRQVLPSVKKKLVFTPYAPAVSAIEFLPCISLAEDSLEPAVVSEAFQMSPRIAALQLPNAESNLSDSSDDEEDGKRLCVEDEVLIEMIKTNFCVGVMLEPDFSDSDDL